MSSKGASYKSGAVKSAVAGIGFKDACSREVVSVIDWLCQNASVAWTVFHIVQTWAHIAKFAQGCDRSDVLDFNRLHRARQGLNSGLASRDHVVVKVGSYRAIHGARN